MLVKEILVKYHKVVPFPWTVKKIKKAGQTYTKLLFSLSTDLRLCEDIETPEGVQLVETMKAMEMFG